MERHVRIAAFASSNRRGSLNRRLLDRAVAALEGAEGIDAAVDVIDLRQYPLPLYDADQQARDGVPAAAHELHDRIAAADALVVANPEYNGGYPALFKNLVDWVTRVDMLVFHPRYVGLLAATPGKGGGARSIEHTQSLLTNIFVTTHERPFALPAANDALTEDGWADHEEADRLAAWAEEFLTAAADHARARAERVA